jgi:hypothetical protein
MYGLKLQMPWDCAPIQNHPGKEHLGSCKIHDLGTKIARKITGLRREEKRN